MTLRSIQAWKESLCARGFAECDAGEMVQEAILKNALNITSPAPTQDQSLAEGVIAQEIMMGVMKRKYENTPISTAPVSSGNYRATGFTFFDLIGISEKSLYFSSPYIDEEGIFLVRPQLENAYERGVAIRLLTRQSPQNRASIRAISAIAKDRFECRDYYYRDSQGQQAALHAKLILADGCMGYLGSAEIRKNAILSNFELGVVLFQAPLLDSIKDLYEATWEQSIPV
jgi:phosphatidylserine/phosphatidylglycerophosphate/cardiolipin synthase-like enzyme